MEYSGPENLPGNRRKAIRELSKGRELANQLRGMLGKSIKDDGSVSADNLVVKILGTFTETLSILNSTNSDEGSRIPASFQAAKSEDSGESSKTSALENRRGCYKRRMTSETFTKVTTALVDDGHAWRKYGQKEILNAKHQRSYYRCTHRFDQGCQATKQVQKIEDEPPRYRTTYHGHHTCKKLLKSPQINFDSTSSRDSSFPISFESKGLLAKKPYEPYFPTMKQEYMEDFPCVKHNESQYSSDFLLSSSDLTRFDPFEPMTMLTSRADYGDVISSGGYSCTASTHSFEMDMNVGSMDFDDFEFELCS